MAAMMASRLPAITHSRTVAWAFRGRPARAGLGLVGVIVALLVWQGASVTGMLPQSEFPTMTSVVVEMTRLPGAPGFWGSLGNTVYGWAIGVLITCIVAIPAGVLVGSSRFAYDSAKSVIEFLKPIPPIALIPLGLLLWGPSLQMKLILVVFGATWPLLTQVIYGIQDVDEVAVKVARVYHLSRSQTVQKIVLPSIAPFVVTGLRLSAAIALIVTVVVEMVGGLPGLGQTIVQAQSSNALPYMYALVLITGILGLVINAVFTVIERHTLHWHPSQRARKSL